jgi:hypothetical protein
VLGTLVPGNLRIGERIPVGPAGAEARDVARADLVQAHVSHRGMPRMTGYFTHVFLH